MKKVLFAGLAIGLLMAANANAAIVENVELHFQSGAEWSGTITFDDGYKGMIAAEGYLNDGKHFTWTWNQGTGQTAPDEHGLQTDWIMSGTVSSYTSFIGLTWDVSESVANNEIVFSFENDPYISGIYGADLLVSYECESKSDPVPEPATMLLFGTGLAGLAAVGRKRS